MYLLISGILFAVFTVNVALGAASNSAFVGDVGEALILFGAALTFTAAILRAEKKKKNDDNHGS